MKLDLVYALNNEGKKALTNIRLIAENEEEFKNLDVVRDYIFWGDSKVGTYPHYDGRRDTPDKNHVQELRFDIPLNTARLYMTDELHKMEGVEDIAYPKDPTLFECNKQRCQEYLDAYNERNKE